MGITSKFRRVTTAAALSTLIGTSALVSAGAAEAAEYPHCVPGDLNTSVAEIPSPNGGRLFQIEFEAKPGVSCQVEGAPSGLTFFNGNSVVDVPVVVPEPSTAEPYTIDEKHPASPTSRRPRNRRTRSRPPRSPSTCPPAAGSARPGRARSRVPCASATSARR
ncbi:hypothetical protein QFW96_23220 [Saccharopolyspora sp. TS4A08]|uniref:DUF4232 domain-containing protein n=1 Tax=Saccharopolyspora ipomoeae TaxID=3042027 RepID=A0ABT6PU98_9PSEU|nr:hypothetical protein [Saccharopolyspora sp. TS4A08]MDI2031558.1 hypothetical protein [Saccharopolyspora sp. TS4A08]